MLNGNNTLEQDRRYGLNDETNNSFGVDSLDSSTNVSKPGPSSDTFSHWTPSDVEKFTETLKPQLTGTMEPQRDTLLQR